MGFSPATKVETGASNYTGISMSMGAAPKAKKQSVRVSITEAAQERLFGRKLDKDKDRLDVLIGRAQDQGMMRLRLDPEGEFELKGGVRGSISVRVARWDLLPEDGGKRPAGECHQIGDTEMEGDVQAITILMPDWANPAKREQAAKRQQMSAKPQGGR